MSKNHNGIKNTNISSHMHLDHLCAFRLSLWPSRKRGPSVTPFFPAPEWIWLKKQHLYETVSTSCIHNIIKIHQAVLEKKSNVSDGQTTRCDYTRAIGSRELKILSATENVDRGEIFLDNNRHLPANHLIE